MPGGEYQVPPKTHHCLLHNHLILRGHLPYIGTKAHPGRSTEPSPESCSSPTLLGVTQAGLLPTSSSSQVGEEASLNSLLKMSLTNSTSCPPALPGPGLLAQLCQELYCHTKEDLIKVNIICLAHILLKE